MSSEPNSDAVDILSELENDTQQSKQGLNIGNLVNSYRYANALLSEKIKIFVTFCKLLNI